MALDDLRTAAMQYLQESIYDGDPGQMLQWLKLIGDEPYQGSGTVRAWYAAVEAADRLHGAYDGGEGCERARLLTDAVEWLDDDALARLIDGEYPNGTDDALDAYREVLRKQPPRLRVFKSDDE